MKKLLLQLIFPDDAYVTMMGEVSTVTVFTGNNNVIDEDGLYSISTFGSLGTEDRKKMFGYISLNTNMVHPELWRILMKLNTLYQRIANGNEYAIFDDKLKDFVKADMTTGDTGYNFFRKHIMDLEFQDTDSTEKTNIITVLKKYKKQGKIFNTKLLVLPAGYREFSLNDDGPIVEDEINDIYRKVLNQAKLVKQFGDSEGTSSLNFKLQMILDDLLTYLDGITNGKGLAINKSWASKAIEYRSRTVLTSIPVKINNINDRDPNTINYCDVGLLQYIKLLDPLTKHHITRQFLGEIFPLGRDDALLVNSKLESEYVEINTDIYDRWTTIEGLDSLMNSLTVRGLAHEPIMLGDYYLALLVDKGDVIEYYTHSNMIPTKDKKYARPIRYGELFYISIQPTIGEIPGTVTRYPVIEQGSTPPVVIKPNTTSETKVVKFIDHQSMNGEIVMKRFPILGKDYINSISLSHAKYAGLTADNDGDQVSVTAVLGEEAKKEMFDLMDSNAAYIGPDGRPLLDVVDKIANFTIMSMCKRK